MSGSSGSAAVGALALFGVGTVQRSFDDIYEVLVGDEDARVCRDISEEACTEVPRNFVLQLLARVASKIGDALSSPRLVLPWLLEGAGVPAASLGALVPVRESGALLPQMFLGGWMRAFPLRKFFWVGGAVGQGVSVAAIALLSLWLTGPLLGWAAVALIALFALSRSLSSISSKDLLGKTIPKTRRGRLGGWSATAAGAIALLTGLAMGGQELADGDRTLLVMLVLAAAAAWAVGALSMALVEEQPGATEGGGNALREGWNGLWVLREDPDLRRYCAARGLMAGTVLAMPFFVLLAKEATEGRIATLGLLMVAAAGSRLLSGWMWGRLADRSSRRTLVRAATGAAAVLLTAFVVAGLDLGSSTGLWIYSALFFLLGLAHTGIRLGRKTYIVDLAPPSERPVYVAVANTLIGILLVASSLLGVVASWISPRGLVLLLGVLALAGAAVALGLPEVEEDGD